MKFSLIDWQAFLHDWIPAEMSQTVDEDVVFDDVYELFEVIARYY